MDRNALLDLIPAYALGALDPEERAEFEAFLAADAEAQKLLAEYQVLTDDLILTTPARLAPAHLGTDLRARLAASRGDTTAAATLPPPVPIEIVATKQPVTRKRTPNYMLAAVAALLIIVGATWILGQVTQRPPADPAERYQWIVSQANHRALPLNPGIEPNTTGQLVTTADGQYGVIQVANLPQLSPDRTFELWLVDANGPRSGGVLDTLQPGATPNYINVPLEKPVDEYTGFGVSIEPQGGSPNPNGPTGDRVFGIQV